MPRRGSVGGDPATPAPNGHDGGGFDRDDDDDDADDDDADDDDADDDDADEAGEAPSDIAAPILGTLEELLDAVAARFDDVTRRPTVDGVDYLLGERPFARLAGARATFRLRPEIVAAAARTPGAAADPQGPEWVSFAPGSGLDGYGADRAIAWFELGHRLAAEAARSN